MTEQVTIQETEMRLLASVVYLKHVAENYEKNMGLTESEVAVNAMMDFYELMKNKPTNGYGKESEDHKNSI